MKKKNAISKAKIKVFDARATALGGSMSEWFEDQIGRVIFRPGTLSFDWLHDGKVSRTICLTTTDNIHYHGNSTKNGAFRAKVNAILYTNTQGHVLIGEWEYEGGKVSTKIVQFFNPKEIRSQSS